MIFDDDKSTVVFPGEDEPAAGGGSYGTTAPAAAAAGAGAGAGPVDDGVVLDPPSGPELTASQTEIDLNLPPPPSQDDGYDYVGGTAIPQPGSREKNFPPCKPLVHHNIKNDIDVDRRVFVRRAMASWIAQSVTLVTNLVVVIAGSATLPTPVSTAGLGPVLWAILAFFVGPPICFCVYYMAYTGVRKNSSMWFCLWGVSFLIFQLATQVTFFAGFPGSAGAGIVGAIDASGKGLVIALMYWIQTLLWVANIGWSCFILYDGRKQYLALGGHKAAAKQFGSAGAGFAREHKDDIKDFAVEHKDDIRDFAVEHKDDIRDFAVENKDVIIDVARENPDLAKEAASAAADDIFS